ncbi:hypothetical protein GCM10009819_29340 [Agromyces tropicus]|uniref:Exo-alpha-sialidase n=1 Tax=Agromyces tropicus TaxID=555371 RepID=A0ABN2URH5_9MICO
MRSAIDERDFGETADETTELRREARQGGSPPPGPPGGKAFERLHAFEQERGLLEFDPTGESAPAGVTEAVREMAEDPMQTRSDLTAEWAEEIASMADAGEGAPRGGAVWHPLGPTVMRNGQTYGSGSGSRVDVSGRVAAIAVDPADSDHLLVGAAGGGVWESRDRGAHWTPRGDRLPTLTVGAIAFDPEEPGLAYLGSGEGDFYAGLGQGVFRSTNGGASWTQLAGSPFIGAGFYALVVDPSDHRTLYAATTIGLYTSSDAGATWTRRRTGRTWSVSVHPGGGDREVLATSPGGLVRSTNRGANWSSVNLTGVPNPANYARLAVSHAPSNGAVAWAWAASDPPMAIGENTQPTPRLWRRASANGAFTSIATDPGVRTGQAWYDWYVRGDPTSDRSVYVGEINAWRVERDGRTWQWTNLSSKVNGSSIHPDQHCLTADPRDGQVVYAGCDGGIYRSPDRGTTWADLNDGLAITEIEYLAQDVGSARWLLGGTQDNGSIRWRANPVWDHVADGDGGDCGASTTDADRVYHSFFRMGLERSTDKGDTWTWVPTANRDPSVYGQLFYPPLEANGSTVAQAGESVIVSRDGGMSFSSVALPGRPVASAMDMPTPDLILVGTTNGRVFRITWSGSSWSAPAELTSPRPGAWISDLWAERGDPSRIWATSSQLGGGRAFRSQDGGSTWTDRSAGLPALPVNAVTVHSGNRNRVWVAADRGVFQSLDAGATWSPMSAGLPNCIIADLLYHPDAHVLRAGTRNRGVWEIEADGLSAPICGVQFRGRLEAGRSGRWFTFRWPATWHVLWTVMPTTVINGAPEISFDVQIERADARYVTYWISVKNLTGRPVEFEGRYAILSYR